MMRTHVRARKRSNARTAHTHAQEYKRTHANGHTRMHAHTRKRTHVRTPALSQMTSDQNHVLEKIKGEKSDEEKLKMRGKEKGIVNIGTSSVN